MSKKQNIFEKFEKKNQPCPQPRDLLMTAARCPRQEQLLAALALDHLAIGLVANKSTKLAKISEILLLSLGLS